MKQNSALETEVLMRIYSDLSSCIYENRKIKKEKNIDTSRYEIVKVEVEMNSEKLFKIYIKIHQYFVKGYLKFLDKLFEYLDSIDEIESIKSVTTKKELSIYQTKLPSGFDTSSYARLSQITLLEHIDDIVTMIIDDYEKNRINNKLDWFTLSEMQQLILLALTHDIGKIIPLMESLNIDKGQKNHEERSAVFMQMFLEGGEYSENLKKPLDRLLGNLVRISTDNTNSMVSRFLEYDAASRIFELKKLNEREK